MSLQQLKSDFNSSKGYQKMNFLPPPNPSLASALAPQLSLSTTFGVTGESRGGESRNFETGLQIFSSSSEKNRKTLVFPEPMESRGGKKKFNDVNNNISVFDKERLPLELVDEDQEGENRTTAGKNGHTKLCARGHWRPAEDAKLKELVAQYGPQNWNLIAENLEGRSGN